MGRVIDHSKHKGNAFVVLLMIANHAKEDGTGAWPSISTLAKKARIGERTVQRTIARLVRSGELSVEVGKGPVGTNLYSVNLTGVNLTGVNLTPVTVCDTGGVSNRADGGVIALSPEPSLKQPSFNRPKSFIAPSLENVTAYCLERKNSIDPQHFLDYYTANGWRVGRNAMKDWKAAVRTWEKNNHGGNGNGTRYESKGELLEKKNKETAERCRRELVDGDGETFPEGHLFH